MSTICIKHCDSCKKEYKPESESVIPVKRGVENKRVMVHVVTYKHPKDMNPHEYSLCSSSCYQMDLCNTCEEFIRNFLNIT